MPIFEPVPIQEAKQQTTAPGPRARIIEEYTGYLSAVPSGHSGKLTPLNGESTAAIRRRLGQAAKALGVDLTVRRTPEAVYFWRGDGRRRGRPRKVN